MFGKIGGRTKDFNRRMFSSIFTQYLLKRYGSPLDVSWASEDHLQKGHSHVDSVLGLPEVSGPWVLVEIRTDLEHAWQRVHNDHFPFRARHYLRRYHEVPAKLETPRQYQLK